MGGGARSHLSLPSPPPPGARPTHPHGATSLSPDLSPGLSPRLHASFARLLAARLHAEGLPRPQTRRVWLGFPASPCPASPPAAAAATADGVSVPASCRALPAPFPVPLPAPCHHDLSFLRCPVLVFTPGGAVVRAWAPRLAVAARRGLANRPVPVFSPARQAER